MRDSIRPASITRAYPTASSVTIRQICVPGTGWGDASERLTAQRIAELREQGVTSVSLTILDADGLCLAEFADFRLEELLVDGAQDEDYWAEIVRVRGINVNCFERGLDCSADDWTSMEYQTNTCRTGKSWIEGPRGLIAAMSSACFEMHHDNITETAQTEMWCVTTPDWMREQAVERMIQAAERACRKIDAQL